MKLENLTFKGGIHIKDCKESSNKKAIERAVEPKIVHIPLHQHIGSAAKSLVKKGDIVKVGQKIGESEASLSAAVHSSVSGTVKSIGKMYTPDGYRVECVTIESDGLKEMDESLNVKRNLDDLSNDEITEILKDKGVVGMGGAGFPTAIKLGIAKDSDIDSIILNGAECEPWLTCDHRIMLEHGEKVIKGLEIMMKYSGAQKGYIGIEDNKKDAIESLESKLKDDKIQIASLKTKFPQGDSTRIVNSVLNRIVPDGGRTKDINAYVNNVGTSLAVAEAILENKPLYERVITVTGNGIVEAKNLLVKIGTTIGDAISQCGGFKGTPGKIVVGGPMTGFAQFSLDTPITKGTTGIIVFTEEESKPAKTLPCMKCAKCVDVCPTHLEPLYISKNALNDRFDVAESLNALACIECGSCSYVCPAKRPLTESIVYAKGEIKSRRDLKINKEKSNKKKS